MSDADSNTADSLGRILSSMFGITRRPYDTEVQLWTKVARSLGVRVSPYDSLETILERVAAKNPTGGGAPAAPSFSTEPTGIDPIPEVGLFAGEQHTPALPGITSITVNHVTNTQGYKFFDVVDLETFSFPNLESLGTDAFIDISGCPKLVTLAFPKLQTAGGDINVEDHPLLTSLLFPILATAATVVACRNNTSLVTWSLPLLTSALSVQAIGCDALENLDWSSLVSCNRGFFILNNASIVSISLPALTTVEGVDSDLEISGNAALTTLSLPNLVFTNNLGSTIYDFTANALSAASVNAILARAVANPAYTSGRLKLEGGTNAAPTGQGAIDKGVLVARGVTVTTN